MKKVTTIIAAFLMMMVAVPVNAQFKVGKLVGAAAKGVQALTITDAQMAAYVKESVDWMDTHNKVSDADSPYTIRLNKLTEGLKDADGIPLNFKVYEVIDVNAFACPDGSVRVFSSLMDIMDDDALMGIIGHEIGHVMKRHSKNAFKQELLTGAPADAVASTGGVAAALTESQLGTPANRSPGQSSRRSRRKRPMTVAMTSWCRMAATPGVWSRLLRNFSKWSRAQVRRPAISIRCSRRIPRPRPASSV